jgi:CRISPR-associated protein Cmr3
LQAAITPRPEVVSGWDMAQKRPKPTRRLVPAGGVYFVRLDGDEASINRWLDATWWQCVSDDEQARRDGFGLCVIGTDPELNGDAR